MPCLHTINIYKHPAQARRRYCPTFGKCWPRDPLRTWFERGKGVDKWWRRLVEVTSFSKEKYGKQRLCFASANWFLVPAFLLSFPSLFEWEQQHKSVHIMKVMKERKGLCNLTILLSNLTWAGSPLTLHACLHQDTVRTQRSSGCRGSFLWSLPVPKSKPDSSGLSVWVLTRWWDLFWGTVPSLYGSEL